MLLENLPEKGSDAFAVLVAKQNDVFCRGVCAGIPCPPDMPVFPSGQMVMTKAVAARGDAFVAACRAAIAECETFTEENDRDGYHDFGSVTVEFSVRFSRPDRQG